MKVAYIFATSRHTVSYVLGKMILPQLEEGRHGVTVVGMFFFEDNNYVLVKGNPTGDRLHQRLLDEPGERRPDRGAGQRVVRAHHPGLRQPERLENL